MSVSFGYSLKLVRLVPPLSQGKHLKSIFEGENHPPQAVSRLCCFGLHDMLGLRLCCFQKEVLFSGTAKLQVYQIQRFL